MGFLTAMFLYSRTRAARPAPKAINVSDATEVPTLLGNLQMLHQSSATNSYHHVSGV